MESIQTPLIDPYGRRLTYLRLSVTDRCNLRCVYCMPREGHQKLPHCDILSYEEILRTARLAMDMGVDKLRITGGEPLIRKDILALLPKLASLPGLEDISLTTNGILLAPFAEGIQRAGIKRINVSLDSLQPERYRRITRFDGLASVWKGLEQAREMGFAPIKINMVVMKGINDDEIQAFADLSRKHPFHVRFIEYMPSGFQDPANPLYFVSNQDILERLKTMGRLVPIARAREDGPTVRFQFEGAPGEVGLISPLTHHFCESCNRLRLTARGWLRPCLFSPHEVDFKTPLRQGASDEELKQVFLEAARLKPLAHSLTSERPATLEGEMSCIGG